MIYDRQILQILSKVGNRGIGVQMLAKHVYNMNCTLFAAPDFREVYAYVQQYLLKNSRSVQSLIERTERRGFYRLNTAHSADARQLLLEFSTPQDEADEKADAPQQDMSLDLFA